MEKLIKFLACVFAIVAAFFSSILAQDTSEFYRSERFETNSQPNVQIRTSGGFIDVIGHETDEVRVEMIVRRGNRSLLPSDTDLEDYEITIRQDENGVIAKAEKMSENGVFSWFGSDSRLSISFVVRAPRGSVIDGRTSGGSVKAVGFNNNVSLRTSGGSVTAEMISGDVELRTSGGSITLTDVEGTVAARTSGGSIRADGLYGRSELRTSGGSIRLEDISGALDARTSGGSIRAEMVDFIDDINLRTSGGSIMVKIPETDHFNVDLRGNRVDMRLVNFTGHSERNRIEGRIGRGGPVIAARTSGGKVEVAY